MTGPTRAHPMTYQLRKWLLTLLDHGVAEPGMGAAGSRFPGMIEQISCPLLPRSCYQLSWLVGHGVIPSMPARSDVSMTTK